MWGEENRVDAKHSLDRAEAHVGWYASSETSNWDTCQLFTHFKIGWQVNSDTYTSMIRFQHISKFRCVFKYILVTWYTFVPCGLGLMAIMAAVALPSYSEHYPPLNYDVDPGPGYSGQNTLTHSTSERQKKRRGFSDAWLIQITICIWETDHCQLPPSPCGNILIRAFVFPPKEPSELFRGPLIITWHETLKSNLLC